MMLSKEDQAIESSRSLSRSPSGGRMVSAALSFNGASSASDSVLSAGAFGGQREGWRPEGASGLNTLVRTLYALQEERVEAYRLFDLQLVHEITQAFNRISKEVIQLKDRFHEEYDRPDLSEHIERVQEREREKLELTARLQLAKQNMLDHPGNETYQEEVQELKHRIRKTIEAINEILQDFKYDSEEIEASG
ncbi:required for excision 1-B domain-containing protein isoform X2 [Rhincodon typus]|uniref:required for excision 1-B domain-containing protein isoform X2 n=1 Tax=Rhincodon typus TaxID=259920 RepID=UPI00202FD1FC|nr:required for excision 1-B domain-containing protein isoform X2 [Rhincodon typus]